MLQLLSFAIGAGITSYSWYKSASKKKEAPSFMDELMPYMKVISLLIAAIILIGYLKKKAD